ncbi:contactin-4 isoform X1 [Hydra vulgaris]|uniref:Contactin-4 isoform X1 n=1 Tax=Hydra vulgaris TaxID=6087 RepID=A0ABM4DGF2_HYDVU
MTWILKCYLIVLSTLTRIPPIFLESNDPYLGFIQEPENGLVETLNYKLTCKAFGDQLLIYSWYKDDIVINNKNNRTLVLEDGSLTIFNALRSKDQGKYRCLVSNRYGGLLSKSAFVTFPYLNEFSAEDSNSRVTAGDKKVLFCNAPDSYPDRNIYWAKRHSSGNYFPLQLDMNSYYSVSEAGDLYFSYTTKEDYGIYYCSVENNKLRRVLKRTVDLKVSQKETQDIVPPEVWVFNDQTAMKNSNFMMECIAFGRPVPTMQFRRVDTNAILKGSYQVGNRLRYEFGSFDVQHRGEYSCEVSNDLGQTNSKTAFLELEASPEMITPDENKFSAQDTTISFRCEATGVPAVTYSWYLNGQLLEPSDGVSTKGTLTITVKSSKSSGFYQCIASNRHGEAMMTIRFSVLETPAAFGPLSTSPAETTHAVVGGFAQIFCIPTGAPKPTITWKKINDTTEILKTSDKYTILPTGTLKINNIKLSDSGIYECTAKNRLGSATRSGVLEVTDGIAITEPLAVSDAVIVGDTILLKCVTSCVQDIEVIFTWYRSQHKLNSNTPRTNIVREKTSSTLTISNSTSKDAGYYTCKAQWANKSVERKIFIIVTGPNGHEVTDKEGHPDVVSTDKPARSKFGPPGKPLYVSATELSGTFVQIFWSKGRDNGSPIVKMHLQVRTMFEPEKWFTVKVSNKTDKERDSEIVELSPWVDYKIRVIAENMYGLGEPSAETIKWIKTPIDKPTKFPLNVVGKGTAPNELKITFQPLEEIDQNAPGISYVVYYKEVHSSYEMIKENVPKGQTFIKIILSSQDTFYKLYEFQLQARNSVGDGPLSPLQTAYTGERTPLVFPTNFKVEITKDCTARAYWDEVPKDRLSLRGRFLGYKFFYWENPLQKNARNEQYLTTHSNSASVKLLPNTEYYFEVLAYNSAGDGPSSSPFGPLKTPESVPSIPANFKIQEASIDYAIFSWNEPLLPNGKIRHYIFWYFHLPNGTFQEEIVYIDELIKRVEIPYSYKTYQFEIAAVTGAGVGESAKITFDFSKLPKIKPNAPAITMTGKSAVVLTWAPVTEIKITGYKVFYWEEGSSEKKEAALNESTDDVVTTIHGLNSGTLYFFQVAVENMYGVGPRSDIVSTLTTGPRVKSGKQDKISSAALVRPSVLLLILPFIVALLVPR